MGKTLDGGLMVPDGVVGRPTYGTLSPQISADGKFAVIGNWTRNLRTLDENAARVPSFCPIIDKILFVHVLTQAMLYNM